MGGWIGKQKRMALYVRDGLDLATMQGLTCACCGRPCIVGAHNSNRAAASLDHQDPRSVTGLEYDSRKENLVSVCFGCNTDRKAKSMAEFLRSQFGEGQALVAEAEIARRLARNSEWDSCLAAAKAAGFKNK